MHLFNHNAGNKIRPHKGAGQFTSAVDVSHLMFISMYEPLSGSSGMPLFGTDTILNYAHEQLIWIRPDGGIDNYGYGDKGWSVHRGSIPYNSALFGAATLITNGMIPKESDFSAIRYQPATSSIPLFSGGSN